MERLFSYNIIPTYTLNKVDLIKIRYQKVYTKYKSVIREDFSAPIRFCVKEKTDKNNMFAAKVIISLFIF